VAIQRIAVARAAVTETGPPQVPAEADAAAMEFERRAGIFSKRFDGFAASFKL
jgi:hypothetical protein